MSCDGDNDLLLFLPWEVLRITVHYLGHGLSHYYGIALNIPREGTLDELASLGDEEKWIVNYSPAFLDHPQFRGRLIPQLVPRISEYMVSMPSHKNVSRILKSITMRCDRQYLPRLLRGPLLFMCTHASERGHRTLQRVILTLSLACITYPFWADDVEESIDLTLRAWKEKLTRKVMYDRCEREYGAVWYHVTTNNGSISIFSKHHSESLEPLYFFIFSGEHQFGDEENRERKVFFSDMTGGANWRTLNRDSDRRYLMPHLCDEDKVSLRRLGSDKATDCGYLLMG